MPADTAAPVDIDPGLLDAIDGLPASRTASHCGTEFDVSPFDLYAVCPGCGARVKVRGFTAGPELEDVFDAVFAWMQQPGGAEAARRRMRELAADID